MFGSVALGYGGVFVCFDKDTVGSYGDAALATVSISWGIPPVTPLGLVGLLQ